MRRPAAFFPIALALGATILVPEASAREATPIKACQTISKPGSYELANNLTAAVDCLVITADFVTIDLAGFLISGGPDGQGISAPQGGTGIAVRNGSIAGFVNSVNLGSANGSIVEGLRVSGWREGTGIFARGIVKGNIAKGFSGLGTGIGATGTVTGNYASGVVVGITVGQGSTVIGNTATDNADFGLLVTCPSNLTDNTAVNNRNINLSLEGEGCHSEDNLAP
jgi:hypothetical protein